jgi:hypothetical protein
MEILRGQRAKCMRSKYFYGTFRKLPRRRICDLRVAKDSQNDPEIPARSPHRAACMAGAPFADND